MQADGAEFDRRSQRSAARSAMGRTARASEWGHTAIFSDEMDADDGATEAGRSARPTARGGRAGSVAGRSVGRAGASRGARLAGDAAAADPQNLLEASTARQLVRSAADTGGRPAAAGGVAADFPRGDDGKMVINEEEDLFGWSKKRKGKRWAPAAVMLNLWHTMIGFTTIHKQRFAGMLCSTAGRPKLLILLLCLVELANNGGHSPRHICSLVCCAMMIKHSSS